MGYGATCPPQINLEDSSAAVAVEAKPAGVLYMAKMFGKAVLFLESVEGVNTAVNKGV